MQHEIILIAEDREDEWLLIQRAFEKAKVVNPLYRVNDGQEVIDYLKGEGKYTDRAEYPLPTLLLLDLKMPRVDGHQVLEWLRQQPELCALRVVVLTNSGDLREVNRAHHLGANSFLVKPVDFTQLVELSASIQTFWLWLSKAPEVAHPNIVPNIQTITRPNPLML